MFEWSLNRDAIEKPEDWFNPSEASLRGMREFEPGPRYLKYKGKKVYLSDDQVKEINKLFLKGDPQSPELEKYFDKLVD